MRLPPWLRSKPVPGRADEANRHIALIRLILERDAQDKKWCTVLHGRTALMVASMQARGAPVDRDFAPALQACPDVVAEAGYALARERRTLRTR
jgi:hypothetical protein